MQDDTDDIETRDREGSLGCGKVILFLMMVLVLVVVLREEASLRSDTRLPLESSQYMAENF